MPRLAGRASRYGASRGVYGRAAMEPAATPPPPPPPSPVWTGVPTYSLVEGIGSANNAIPVAASGDPVTVAWVSGVIGGSTVTSKPAWITFSAAQANPTVSFSGHVDANDVSSMVWSATANSTTASSEQGSIVVDASAPVAALAGFYDVPTLQDERDTYDLLGWARTSSDEDFDFVDTGAVNPDVHDDTEADDLWTWYAQLRRGYNAAIATTMFNRWLTYYRGGTYRTNLPTSAGDFNPPTAADPMCHLYGPGLAFYGSVNPDSASISEAEAIADLGIPEVFGGVTSSSYPIATGENFGYGGGRQMARIGQLVAHLAYVTGKAKWTGWLNAMADAYMGASTWADTTSGLGIAAGGAYFCDLDWMDNNGQQGFTAYNNGARSNATYQYAMHGEFLWRAYLLTGRADVRDRIVKFARFMEYYAHDPAMTAQGGPFCGAYFGITPGGGRWHRDNPGAALYDASPINILVWGYKLTGDSALLTRARVHLDKCNRWKEGQPQATGEAAQTSSGTVYTFIDTRRNTGGSPYFTNNKGQLQYVYQVFENGGSPPTLNSAVPAFIRNLSAGSVATLATKLPNAWQTFAGMYGGDHGSYPFSGGTWDSSRGRLLRHGGGHNDYNGNEVYALQLYDVAGTPGETPAWQRIKNSSPPRYTTPDGTPANDTNPDGSPTSSHTYNQIIYDPVNDRMLLMGLGSVFSQGGGSSARIRALNLQTLAWDTYGSLPNHSSAGQGGMAVYDELQRCVWRKALQSNGGSLDRFDVTTNALVTVSDGRSTGIEMSLAIDPVRGIMIAVGGDYDGNGQLMVWNLNTYNGSSVTSYNLSGITNFPSAYTWAGGGAVKAGLEYHPPSKSFVMWKGGSVLYRLIPGANPFTAGGWTVTPVTPSGAGLPNANGFYSGVYSKFKWAPYPHDKSRGVFVMDIFQGTQESPDSTTRIYKPDF